MAVTKRQKQVLDFVARFIEDNGYSPSYEEIARGLDLASLATVATTKARSWTAQTSAPGACIATATRARRATAVGFGPATPNPAGPRWPLMSPSPSTIP